jgi:hypothetical protein
MSVRLVSLTPRLNRALRRRAGSGLRAYLPKFARSSLGDVRLNLSFWPIGMMTSLISGLPSRETCRHPRFMRLREPWPRTYTLRRSVVAHTPTAALPDFASSTDLPLRVTWDSGTWRTNAWVLYPATSSLPPPWLPRPMFGRPGLSMLIPSKIVFRSRKNGSSAGPTNVLPPPRTEAMAPFETGA